MNIKIPEIVTYTHIHTHTHTHTSIHIPLGIVIFTDKASDTGNRFGSRG